ncbi:hypothetical protein RF11_04930 [Thelohanellus kitauei]|uniref:Integrase zinc-binding domain-containing protein n=1 Tax=Thelohanellus kitauei TaxID=669202 RepID=A0A0C2MTD7_THEKT|nr:hypothetical protein RF11_04930 [Thelohanellus kitauei]
MPTGHDVDLDNKYLTWINSIDLINMPLKLDKIRHETAVDLYQQGVIKFHQNGWPSVNPSSPYNWFYRNRSSITLEDDILVLNMGFTRVVTPKIFQADFLMIIDKGHWGIVLAKQLARKYCSWTEIDRDIEKMVRSCVACAKNSVSPTKEFTIWPQATGPFERSHVDSL